MERIGYCHVAYERVSADYVRRKCLCRGFSDGRMGSGYKQVAEPWGTRNLFALRLRDVPFAARMPAFAVNFKGVFIRFTVGAAILL